MTKEILRCLCRHIRFFFNAQVEVRITTSVASAPVEPKQKEVSSSPAAPLLLTMAQMNKQLKLHPASEKQPDIC